MNLKNDIKIGNRKNFMKLENGPNIFIDVQILCHKKKNFTSHSNNVYYVIPYYNLRKFSNALSDDKALRDTYLQC